MPTPETCPPTVNARELDAMSIEALLHPPPDWRRSGRGWLNESTAEWHSDFIPRERATGPVLAVPGCGAIEELLATTETSPSVIPGGDSSGSFVRFRCPRIPTKTS